MAEFIDYSAPSDERPDENGQYERSMHCTTVYTIRRGRRATLGGAR